MDITLVVIGVLIVIVLIYFSDFKSVVYFVGILDILFRVMHKISSMINVRDYDNFVINYIPNDIESIVDKYSIGLVNNILEWVLVVIYVFFLYYVIIYWIKKKK